MKQSNQDQLIEHYAGQLSCEKFGSFTQLLKAKAFEEKTGAQFRKISRMEYINGLEPKDDKAPLTARELLNTERHEFNKIAEIAITAYREKKLPLEPVLKSLTHLQAMPCKTETLEKLSETVSNFAKKGYRLAGLIESASSLLASGVNEKKCTAKVFEAFGFAYQWMDIQIRNFTEEKRFSVVPEVAKAINANMRPDALFAFCSVLSRTENFEMEIPHGTFRRYTGDVRLKGETDKDIEIVFSAAVKCGFDISKYEVFAQAYFTALHQLTSEIEKILAESQRASVRSAALGRKAKRLSACLKEFRDGVNKLSKNGIADTDFISSLGQQIIKAQGRPLEVKYLVSARQFLNVDSDGGILDYKPEISFLLAGNKRMVGSLPVLSGRRMSEFCRMIENGEVKSGIAAFKELTRLSLEQFDFTAAKKNRINNAERKFLLKNAEDAVAAGQRFSEDMETAVDRIHESRKSGNSADLKNAQTAAGSLNLSGADKIRALSFYLMLCQTHQKNHALKKSVTDLFVSIIKKFNSDQDLLKSEYLPNTFYICRMLGELKLNQQINFLKVEISKPDSVYTFKKLYNSALDIVMRNQVNLFSRTSSDDHVMQYYILDQMEEALKTDVAISANLPVGALSRSLDVIKLQMKLNKYHYGFLGLAADAEHKQDPFGRSMLERMARALAEYQIIHSKDISGNPGGPGIAISHLQTDRIFAPDLERLGDKYHLYKEAWPEYAEIIDYLKHANFCFTRGWVSVSVPRDTKLKIQSKYMEDDRHYTLIIFNDHHGSLGDSAFLVDTKLFFKKIKPALHDSELFGETTNVVDINSTGLTAFDLLEHEKTDPYSVINIGSGNNIAGGFVNAVSLESAYQSGLLHDHLPGSKKVDLYNSYGHPNFELDHAIALWLQVPVIGPDRLKFHEDIKDVARRNIKYMDLFMVGLSQYKKGYVNEKQDPDIDTSSPDADSGPEIVRMQEEPAEPNMALFRMLNEAKEYRAMARRKDYTSDNYRVLTLCDSENPSSLPKSDLFLDTESGVLHAGGKDFQMDLDAGTLSDRDKEIWQEQVMPRLTDYFKTLRFYQKMSLAKE